MTGKIYDATTYSQLSGYSNKNYSKEHPSSIFIKRTRKGTNIDKQHKKLKKKVTSVLKRGDR